MSRALAIAVILAAPVVAAPVVQAQINLPPVRTPTLPQVELPADVGEVVDGVTDTLDRTPVAEVRRLRVRELLRLNRDVLERDPAGAAIVRAELIAFSPSEAALERAREEGFTVSRERLLEGLDERIIVLMAPEGLSTRRALRRLRALDPEGAYDYNHIYLQSGEVEASTSQITRPDGAAANQAAGGRIGLIDGGIDVAHPALRAATIVRHGCEGESVPSGHGTAVASLIVGETEGFRGAAPGATLYAADVYCGRPVGGAVDAVADALSWMARERVPVINVSLVGPENVALRNVIRVVTARGHIVVAAVGNDGPTAPPLYPAAYPDVLGVTAVDARRRALPEAARGKHVDFAAPGADMTAADATGGYVAVRGTSFASPIVAGLLTRQLRDPQREAAAHAIEYLASQAVDLGSRGPDRTYGKGLVGDGLCVQPAVASRGAIIK